MKRSALGFALVLCLAGGAYAQEGQQQWSVLSGQTMGLGNTGALAEVGWPGIDGEIVYGMQSNLDLGVKFAFNYGVEGDTSDVHPGLVLQGVFKYKLLDNGGVKVGFLFQPGPILYFYPDPIGTQFGFTFPVGINAAIPVSHNLMVNAGMDINMSITFTGGLTVFRIPVLIGGGMEYFIDSKTALTFTMKMGPIIGIASADGNSASGTDFDMRAMIGIAFKIG